MNRRGFLGGLVAAVPAVIASEELLELLAPRRTIFLPPRAVSVSEIINNALHMIDVERLVKAHQIARDLVQSFDAMMLELMLHGQVAYTINDRLETRIVPLTSFRQFRDQRAGGLSL